MNGKINKTIKTKEEIKKHQIEIGAVADGIVGFETIQKNIERFKKMKKGEKIKYAIIKQVSMYSFIEWLESWEIDREDWDKFMKAGEQALDGEDDKV